MIRRMHPRHLDDLRRSGLTDETIRAAGIHTVPPGEISKRLGGLGSRVMSAYAIPYPGCDGFERLRVFYDEGQSGPKYLQKQGTGNHLYVPAGIDLRGSKPLLIPEGEKKALALRQAGYQAVAIPGVWGWCQKGNGYRHPGEMVPIADLEKVVWAGRPTALLFDSDAHVNPLVRLAAFRLARELSRRGARVSILFLPPGPGRGKVGADDFLVAHGEKALRDLLETASPFDPAWSDPEAEVWWQVRDLGPNTPLPEKLKRLAALIPTLARLSHTEALAILEDLREKLGLRVGDLTALRADLKRAQREKRKTPQQGAKAAEPEYRAVFPGLVDIVATDDGPAFLVKTPEGGLGITPTWEVDGQEVQPPPLAKIPWLLPRAAEVERLVRDPEPATKLWADLEAWFAAASELPSPAYHLLQVAWVFHTYLLEAATYSPEICFYAVPERGKTRTGKALIYVARRGVHVESLRDAYLLRLAHNCQAALFFDCLDLWKKAEKAGCEDIILGRFERGIKVPRVLYPERGPHRDTVFYDIFGPTIIATNVPVSRILDTRAVQINMPQASQANYEMDLSPEMALPLKERLTAWRARTMGKPVPDCQKPAPVRLGDILKFLLQMVLMVHPDEEDAFRRLIGEIQRTRKIDRATSLKAQILLTIKKLEPKVYRGLLAVKTITDSFNDGRPEKEQLTYQRMGRKLRSLGFEPAQTETSAAAIVWDREKIARLFSAYGLGETSESSETSGSSEEDSDGSDDSDVFTRASGENGAEIFDEEL